MGVGGGGCRMEREFNFTVAQTVPFTTGNHLMGKL